ncbi:MAG: sulfite exporter TauE/SafE family protein [Pseudanabaena sp.]|nr:MAG: sulfite exporter TauE/SafE family protein [Pseudanabaena sp.]
MSEITIAVYLGGASFLAWIVSTLAGGGSPFILIPLVNLLMGASAVPPIITIGMFLGNAHRVFLFWRSINWELTAWYAPSAILGSFLGAYTFTKIHLDWLQLVIGIFLIVSAVLFFLEKETTANVKLAQPNAEILSLESGCGDENKHLPKPKFELKAWHIVPAGFLKAYVSGLVGTTGPVLNPFYLSYGLVKEQMLATKATHVVIIHLVKIITYGAFSAMSREQVVAGLAIGCAAIPANLVGKYLLSRMSAQQFRQVVLAFMAIGGMWMLWGQRNLFLEIL